MLRHWFMVAAIGLLLGSTASAQSPDVQLGEPSTSSGVLVPLAATVRVVIPQRVRRCLLFILEINGADISVTGRAGQTFIRRI